MQYFKSSQPVPGKGFAWTFYECDDDRQIERYLTFFTETGEVKRVGDPVVKELYDGANLLESSKEEFELHWPEGQGVEKRSAKPTTTTAQRGSDGNAFKAFSADMTIGEAMAVHPRVAEVFAAFHLGGCSSCGISQIETVGQVCAAYGVDLDTLLEVLEGLLDKQPEPETASS
jgi:hybrid cluster-associated redox disulfide protein